jgi:hypothetical protein
MFCGFPIHTKKNISNDNSCTVVSIKFLLRLIYFSVFYICLVLKLWRTEATILEFQWWSTFGNGPSNQCRFQLSLFPHNNYFKIFLYFCGLFTQFPWHNLQTVEEGWTHRQNCTWINIGWLFTKIADDICVDRKSNKK